MHTRSRHSPSSRRPTAFTLIEVMLVMIILVILGSLAQNIFTNTQDQANIRAATAQVGMIGTPFNLFRLNMNKYPDKLEDLWKEPSDSDEAKKWGAAYMEKLSEDPWGNSYQYLAEGKKNSDKYDFWSYGPDGEDGTEDDIGNWEDE